MMFELINYLLNSNRISTMFACKVANLYCNESHLLQLMFYHTEKEKILFKCKGFG